MSSSLQIDLFVEDVAHEEFMKAMISRLAREENKPVTIRSRSARGGHGRALTEFLFYQKAVESGLAGMKKPDLLVVAIDANCRRLTEARKEIEGQIRESFKHLTVIACPDPHIERWYLSDPTSFAKVVGYEPKLPKRKCERDYYKRLLASAVQAAGHPATLGGIEFARELVDEMNLYQAAKSDKALQDFLQSSRSIMKKSFRS
jgi:hypothetical protein